VNSRRDHISETRNTISKRQQVIMNNTRRKGKLRSRYGMRSIETNTKPITRSGNWR
jgi:hypothetical protein